MDWYLTLIIFLAVLLFLLMIKVPVAFSFLALNLAFAYILWAGGNGVKQVVLSMETTIESFVMSPLVMFIIMGEVLFHSGIAFKAIDTIDKLLGRLPGGLGIVTIVSGTLVAALTGSSVGSTAMLGTILTPDMERRGYGKEISMGAVMAGGGLAVIIPPSGPAVLIGAIAQVSVGAILISGILPGVLMACLYAAYVIGICLIKPSIVPRDKQVKSSLSDKLVSVARNLLPFSIIVFAVMGAMFLGIATPTESAALGATASFLLAIFYGKANWELVKKTAMGSIRVAIMIFFLLGSAMAFSQILAFTGATQGMIQFMTSINLPPILIVGIIVIIVIFLGTFMDGAAILMITIPVFMPIIRAIGYNEILFCLLMLVGTETGLLTPPFGLNLFVMKGVAKASTTAQDIYKSAIPFVICNVIALALLMLFPQLTLFLPNIMK